MFHGNDGNAWGNPTDQRPRRWDGTRTFGTIQPPQYIRDEWPDLEADREWHQRDERQRGGYLKWGS